MQESKLTLGQVGQRRAEKRAAIDRMQREIAAMDGEFSHAVALDDEVALKRIHQKRDDARQRLTVLQSHVAVLDAEDARLAAGEQQAQREQRLAALADKGRDFIKQGDRVQAILDDLLVEFARLSDLGQEYLALMVVPYQYGELPTLPIGDHRVARAIMLELYAKSDGRFSLPNMGASPWQVRQAPNFAGRVREAVKRAEARQRTAAPDLTPPEAA